jgi:hypothetical protein
MKSRIISRNAKTLLYKTLIRPVLTYGAETWVLSKQDENRLSIFERKILRRIYGSVMDRGKWRIRLGCRNWKVVALNREGWKKLLKEAEAHPRL